MNVQVTEKNENPLLGRTDVRGTASFEGATPSNADITEVVAKNVGGDPALVVMKHIYTKFSHQEVVFHAVVYKDQLAMEKAEVMTKHLRKKAEEVAKAEAKPEAPAEPASEAAPAEEAAEAPAEEASEEAAEEAPSEAESSEETPTEEAPAEPKEEAPAEPEAKEEA